jgi:hypothetical protein
MRCVLREIELAAGRRISCEVAGRRDSTIKGTSMRKLISLTMMGVLALGLGIGIAGCSEEAGTKTQTTTTSPGGTTKVTEQTKIQQSGDNPPPPKAP